MIEFLRTARRVAFSPPAQPGKVDTGLRFTDVLFGFVIKELFLRLQNWSQLAWYVRGHLIVGAALVLGSWIGFRRSLNRTTYEVKFFNLPFFRFLADQLMVILYFRIAVLTALDGAPPSSQELATTTAQLLVLVFSLYAVWDILGFVMAKAKVDVAADLAADVADDVPAGAGGRKPKYPKLDDGEMTADEQGVDRWGLLITISFLAPLVVLWVVTDAVRPGTSGALWTFAAAAFLLIGYRFFKEVRTSWPSP